MPYKDPEKQRERRRAYYLANKEQSIAYTYQYRKDHPEWWLGQRRNAQFKRLYGISTKEYENLVIKQDGECAVCRRQQFIDFRSLQVDHDHKTGKVRGLLCPLCNKALGLLLDDPSIIENLLVYARMVK